MTREATPPTLTIPRLLFRRLVNHCREEKPLEACGMLVGGRGIALGGYPVTNKARSPVRYHMDEGEQLAAWNDMESRGLELAAIYHSHPTAEPKPSPSDIQLAYYPEAFYIIVSLAKATPAVRAFRIVDRRVLPARIVLDDDNDGFWSDLRAI